MNLKSQAAIASNAKRNARCMEAYLKSPKLCAICDQVLLPRPDETLYHVRKRQCCSRRCANFLKPKRKPEGRCKTCIKPIPKKRTFCNLCVQSPRRSKFFDPSFLTKQKSEVKRYDIAFHARIVLFAVEANKTCRVCGYTFIVEAAHRKAVKNFPPTALIRDINDLSNLVPLCRNHHAEFDLGALQL